MDETNMKMWSKQYNNGAPVPVCEITQWMAGCANSQWVFVIANNN